MEIWRSMTVWGAMKEEAQSEAEEDVEVRKPFQCCEEEIKE